MNPAPAFSRRRYFAEEEDEHWLASLVQTTNKSSSSTTSSRNSVISSSNFMGYGNSSRHHFLGSCSLCGRRIDQKRDVYMYMGDTPFCTEECREQRIAEDEAKQMQIKGGSSSSASMKKERKKSAYSFYGVRTGPMAAV